MATSKKGPDLELFRKLLKKLETTRGNTRDDVADLPDSLPLGGTTAIFLTAPRKRDNKADEDAPTPEREKFAHVLGERTGKDIDPLDIRVEGHWVFYQNFDHPLEIECYRLPLTEKYTALQRWTDIPLKDSPFEPNNADAVSKAIEKLDYDYPEQKRPLLLSKSEGP